MNRPVLAAASRIRAVTRSSKHVNIPKSALPCAVKCLIVCVFRLNVDTDSD